MQFTLNQIKNIVNNRSAVVGNIYEEVGGVNNYVGILGGTLLKITKEQIAAQTQNPSPSVIPVTPVVDNDNCLFIDYVSTAVINQFDPVTAQGKVANSNLTVQKNRVIGLAIESVGIGFGSQVVGFGQIENDAWSWIVGSKIFLNGSALSTIAPTSGFIQLIGIAVKPNIIDIKLGQSILL